MGTKSDDDLMQEVSKSSASIISSTVPTETSVLLVVSVGGLYALQLFLNFRKAVQGVGNHPGLRTLISSASILGNLLPSWRAISPGRNRAQGRKHLDFVNAGWDAYAAISAWPTSRTIIFLADAGAIKEVTTSRARFPKPVEQYKVLTFFGRNIVASEHDEWKRYRKVSAPAFSERNNKLVWDETMQIMVDMLDNVWKNQLEVTVDHCVEITLPIALFVIGVAGFGRRISWTDDLKVPPGHTMTFKDALHTVSTDVFLKLIIPDRAMGLTKRFRHVRDAFKELDLYMLEMISSRRNAGKKEERYDLFSSLLDASEDTSDGDAKLSDSELVGNIFIFLVAGHETTAHTLCFTFALLALHPEQQERLYEDIKRQMPDPTRVPTYEEMGQFTWSMAAFYETMRMFPPISAEDTSLVVGNTLGEKKTIPIPRGTDIIIHTPGLHYNPRYWENPHEFKPERFLGDWPRDAFFETEGIAILTMLMSRYKVEVKEEPEFANETFEERKARVLASKPGLTQTPIRDTRYTKHHHTTTTTIDTPSTMRELPLELAKAISDEVSAPSDLRALRAASKWWHAKVTPRAFHMIIIRDTAHSATGLANILQDAALAQHVREIAYQDPKADSEGKLTEPGASRSSSPCLISLRVQPELIKSRQGYERNIPDDAIDALGAAFALTDRASVLETVTLIFYPVYFEVFPWDDTKPSSQLRAQRAISAV
ncbi:hypothetical protein EVG20_g9110 [Dentipellis fragilis]|uniref:Cytochrome P450 n=1 Tax=Dentipellis fragilis TaxID=205917 RepID=A0A4Y9Y0N1_9AGAM|nr:hypothetical protein EVG20_g9110 [Dentipellis fragilis]